MSITPRPVDAAQHVGPATPLTVTFGSSGGWNAGDWVVLFVQTENETPTLSDAQGFVEEPAYRDGTGTPGAAGATGIAVFVKYATGDSSGVPVADGNPTIAACVGHISAQMQVFAASGSWAAFPNQPFDSCGRLASSSSTSAKGAGIPATRGSNISILTAIANALPSATTEQGSAWANSSLSFVTNQAFAQTNLGHGGGFDTMTGVKVAAGAVSQWTMTLASASVQASCSIGFTDGAITQGLHPSLQVSSGAFALNGSPVTLTYVRNDPAIAVPVSAFDETATSTGWFAPEAKPVGWFDEDIPSGVVLNHYVLTAGSGSFALAGSAVNLRADRRITAGAGAFVEAGSSVGLLRAMRIIAGGGSFAASGASVQLRAARVIAAASGVFVLAGSSAGLVRAQLLTAASGSFALTGPAVDLRAARRLTASAGAFVLAGTAAALRSGRTLSAAPGSFALVGSDAAMRAARSLQVNPGAFEVAGMDALLRRGRILSVAGGSFAVDGSNAILLATRRLVAESGAFLVDGANAVLFISLPADVTARAVGELARVQVAGVLASSQGATGVLVRVHAENGTVTRVDGATLVELEVAATLEDS